MHNVCHVWQGCALGNSSLIHLRPTQPKLVRCNSHLQTYFVEAAKADERFDAAVDELPGVKTRSTLCVPLPAASSQVDGGDGDGEAPAVGVLQLTNKTRRRPLVAFDKELADLLACNLASSVHHIARAAAAAALRVDAS
jgi:GAF domain-containing protein